MTYADNQLPIASPTLKKAQLHIISQQHIMFIIIVNTYSNTLFCSISTSVFCKITKNKFNYNHFIER